MPTRTLDLYQRRLWPTATVIALEGDDRKTDIARSHKLGMGKQARRRYTQANASDGMRCQIIMENEQLALTPGTGTNTSVGLGLRLGASEPPATQQQEVITPTIVLKMKMCANIHSIY